VNATWIHRDLFDQNSCEWGSVVCTYAYSLTVYRKWDSSWKHLGGWNSLIELAELRSREGGWRYSAKKNCGCGNFKSDVRKMSRRHFLATLFRQRASNEFISRPYAHTDVHLPSKGNADRRRMRKWSTHTRDISQTNISCQVPSLAFLPCSSLLSTSMLQKRGSPSAPGNDHASSRCPNRLRRMYRVHFRVRVCGLAALGSIGPGRVSIRTSRAVRWHSGRVQLGQMSSTKCGLGSRDVSLIFTLHVFTPVAARKPSVVERTKEGSWRDFREKWTPWDKRWE